MSLDIDKFFEDLLKRCETNDVYSVRDICSNIGINYDYIQMLASKNPEKGEILQMCRDRCYCNTMDAGLRGKLSIREAHNYWIENDDEYARNNSHEQFFDDDKH